MLSLLLDAICTVSSSTCTRWQSVARRADCSLVGPAWRDARPKVKV
jgi:hypothetical protein